MKVYYQLSARKRIELEDHDIHTLLFLNEQGMVSQPQLFQFFILLKDMQEAAFRRKMNRWDDANIIQKQKYRIQNGHEIALISLTNQGQTILKKLGFIPEKDVLKYKPKSNIDHTLAIKQTVIEMLKIASQHTDFYFAEGGKYLIALNPNGIRFNVNKPIWIYKRQNTGTDIIPEFHPFGDYNNDKILNIFKEKGGVFTSYVPKMFEETTNLIPDWVFQVKDHYFYIEVDTGTEKVKSPRDQSNYLIDKFDTSSIEGKLYRYDDMVKKQKEQAKEEGKVYNKSHHVIFALLDDSRAVITTQIQSKKDTRIANLKHEISFMDHFSEWNIEVSVVGLKRFSALMKKLHQQTVEQSKKNGKNYYEILEMMCSEGIAPEGWMTNFITPDKFSKVQLPTHYSIEGMYIFLKKANRLDQYMIPVFVREGNVEDMEKIDYLTIPVEQGKFKTDAKILAIYETKEELENDILRKTQNIYTHKFTGEQVDNNGMKTDNLLFIALDELKAGELSIYTADKKAINPYQLFL